MSEQRSKGLLRKNNQTEQAKEPVDTKTYRFGEKTDFLNNTAKQEGRFISNNRATAISYFFESNFGPRYQRDYSEGLEKFPNLFNKQKSEFLKFANVNEPS
jgi:hypothetical protein